MSNEAHLKFFDTGLRHCTDSDRGDLKRRGIDIKQESSESPEGVFGGGGRTSTVALFAARLHDQHQEIVSLTRSVAHLTDSIERQNTEIRSLRCQMNTLKTKVECNHDNALETRFEQVQMLCPR